MPIRIEPITNLHVQPMKSVADAEKVVIPVVDQSIYYKDSIESAADRPFESDSPLAVAAKHAKEVNFPFMRPQLPKPDPIDFQIIVNTDLAFEKIITKKRDLDGSFVPSKDLNKTENELLKMLIACMKSQSDLHKDDEKISIDEILKNQKANTEIQKDFFKKYDELIERTKQSKKLGWVNKILTGALFVLGLIGIGASIFTGGAALPLVFTIANGILSISSGSITITQSILDDKSGKQQGIMFELQAHREMNQEKINNCMNEIQQAFNFVLENWKQLRKILVNMHQTSLNTMRE